MEKDIIEDSKKHAEKNGIKLNSDKEILDIIIKGLSKNEKEFGKRYCPCRRRTGDEKEDRKIICPCIYHMQEIKEMGHCHCMLFTS